MKIDYVDSGAHIQPHCGPTNAKLRANIPVGTHSSVMVMIIMMMMVMIVMMILLLPTVWCLIQVTMAKQAHMKIEGVPSFRQRVADQILQVIMFSYTIILVHGAFHTRVAPIWNTDLLFATALLFGGHHAS